MLKIGLLGRRIHRQPLAYPALRQYLDGHLRVVDDPENATILLLSHMEDLEASSELLHFILSRNKRSKVVLLSEEPFWDLVWGPDMFSRSQEVELPGGTLPITYLNHFTSGIYDFEALPYFLVTSDKFFLRYSHRFARNASRSEAQWITHFRQAPIQAAFYFERRTSEKFDAAHPAREIFGLCRFRSQLAELYQTGVVRRIGRGWQKGARRQELPDWHLEKLGELDGRCRFVSALENTHQANYISEKFFDVMAVGAIPIYRASPEHRIHAFVEKGSWLNVAGLAPGEAAAAIDSFEINGTFFEAYMESQRALAKRFESLSDLERERKRIAGAVLAELNEIASHV